MIVLGVQQLRYIAQNYVHGSHPVRIYHYNDVMTSEMASQITNLTIAQAFIRGQIKENIKAPRHWPLFGEFTGDR